MTSQPDPKDGPPDLPEPFWNALHEWSMTRHESFSDKEHLRARMAFSTARVREEYAAAVKAAALRVVPPEGGPRPDEVERVAKAIWDAQYKHLKADVLFSDPDNEFWVTAADECRVQARAAIAALRASGAGTRQEELLWVRQIAAVDRWQHDDRVHPLTCGNDSGHNNLIPALVYGKAVLLCPECDYMQTHIPAVVTNSDFVAPLGESRPNE